VVNECINHEVVEFSHELLALVCDHFCTRAVGGQYAMKEGVRGGGGCFAGDGNEYCSLAVMLYAYHDVLVTAWCGREGTGEVNPPPVEQAHNRKRVECGVSGRE
jgi:hypothetical protein